MASDVRVCVSAGKCVYSMYGKCVYQCETNFQQELEEWKNKQYCPVGLRQSWN